MDAGYVVPLVLLVVGACAGLAAYEALVRWGRPDGPPAPRVGDQGREGGVDAGGSARHSRAAATLAVLSGWIERVAPFARADADACRARLGRAGVQIVPETWRAFRLVAAVAGALAAGLAGAALGGGVLSAACAIGGALGAAVGWRLPAGALSRREARRRRMIEARLPDAMELLGIAIAAGSPVEQCFREVAASLQGPLAEEFSLVDQEVNLLGHTREKALENLAERCRSREVSSFVAQLTQAVSQGSSIAEGLACQAALARDAAQASALERIRAMPTKLDIVLSLCFLPPTVVLVVVPTVVNLLQFLNETMM